MCLVVFSYQYPQDYHFILWANRDEFFHRPSQRAGYWEENPNIWGGKDLQSGGTWLGIHKGGKFAFLTNYRNLRYPPKKNPPSRGKLVSEFLLGKYTPQSYLTFLQKTKDEYEGYNLVWGNWETCLYYNNRLDISKTILPGIHTLSNGILDEPWYKSERIRKFFMQVDKDKDWENPERAFLYLQDRKKLYLPWKLPRTGLGCMAEFYLSSICVWIPGNPKKNRADYGTRSHTYICIPKGKEPILVEKISLDRTLSPGK